MARLLLHRPIRPRRHPMVAPALILHRYRGTVLTPNRAGGRLNSLGNDRSGPHHCSRGRSYRTRPDSAQLYELHGLRHTASVQPIKSTAEMMQDQTDSRGGFSRTRHWTLERRFKSGARSDDKGPDDKRRAHAGSDRADSGVSHCGRSPRSSTTRLPCFGVRAVPLYQCRLGAGATIGCL